MPSNRIQRSMDAMGTNIWTKFVRFGNPLGVAGNNVIAYSSEYRSADPNRFDGDSYSSSVDVEVSAHGIESDAANDSNQGTVLIVRHRHQVSETDPAHMMSLSVMSDTAPSSPVIASQTFTVYAGAKFQCVEYARRYLIMTHLVTFPSIPMAYHILLSMKSFAQLSFTSKKPGDIQALKRPMDAVRSINAALPSSTIQELASNIFPPSATVPWASEHHRPVPGSLLIWAPSGYFKTTGHVAVVVAVDDERIYIGEQNVTDCVWPESQPFARSFPIEVSTSGDGRLRYGITDNFVDGIVWGWVTPQCFLPSSL